MAELKIHRPPSAGSLILAQLLDRLREKLIPHGSRREFILRPIYVSALKWLLRMLRRQRAAAAAASCIWNADESYGLYGNTNEVFSILIVKLDHLGDFLLSLDAVLVLREAFPQARFTLLCDPANKELAHGLGLFEAVHTMAFFSRRPGAATAPYSVRVPAAITGQCFDLAVDLRVDALSNIVFKQLVACCTFGYQSMANPCRLTLALPQPWLPANAQSLAGHQRMLMLQLAHAVVDFCRPAAEVGRLLDKAGPPDGKVDLTCAEDRPLVVCCTGSGRAVKNWPVERFATLISWLCNEQEVAVLLLGTAEQAADARHILPGCKAGRIVSAVGDTSLPQAITLLRRAALYIGNDSGLTHLAARLGVPTIALYSGISPVGSWAPVGPDVTVLHAPVACSPCHIQELRDCVGKQACLLNISEVFVQEIVAQKLSPHRRDGTQATPAKKPPAPARLENPPCTA